MTPVLSHTITVEEATALREYVADPTSDLHRGFARHDQPRLWAPIEMAVSTTGRARCRLCSEQIERDAECIRFGFDPYGDGNWGRLGAAYLHLTCPREETTNGD